MGKWINGAMEECSGEVGYRRIINYLININLIHHLDRSCSLVKANLISSCLLGGACLLVVTPQ